MDHNFWLIVLILFIGAAIAGVAVLMFIAALKALGIDMSIEAMKLALEALEDMHIVELAIEDLQSWNKAVKSLRQAIAEAEKQEPVAFDVTLTEEESKFLRDTIGVDDVSPIRLTVGDGHSGHGLYVSNADYQEEGSALIVNTHPQPKREWVGLTVMEAVELDIATNHPREFAAAIEAKLKEKNT